MANAYCERVVGSIRRECLDYLIPLNARHLKRILREFITHYNRHRPHSAMQWRTPSASRLRRTLLASRLTVRVRSN